MDTGRRGTLDMPNYPDLETCRHKMTQMLRLGRSHFDEGAGNRGQAVAS